ncbi:MAG TPA: MarR family transcriptional regulator [Thermomicrobiales bacterium]|nr:MarR family transcriptional regulator [Thermomicrobiales bacterium]
MNNDEHMTIDPERLLFDVWLVSRAAEALLDEALAPAGLTADEFALHSALHHAGPVTPSRLAELLALPPTTVSTYLRRLEQRGALARVPNPDDRRSSFIQLTPQGEASYQRTRECFLPVHAHVAQGLAVPLDEVQASLAALDAAVRQARNASH